MRNHFLVTIILLIVIAPVFDADATEYMALNSGHSCSYCHLDPTGGGELTDDGELFLAQLYDAETEDSSGTLGHIFRLIVGYLHILFAVLWFGTILYVHIVLKPAYAAKGLPRGEKMVGVLSFWVVGITGVLLTVMRFSSWSQLFDTRFGILLSVKVGLYLLMMISAIFVVKIIGPRLSKKTNKEHVPGEPFNAATLSFFDGKDGRPCYFAYNGTVYDATESDIWADGEHMKRHTAGTDLTEALSLAPHNEQVMERLKVAGEYEANQSPNSGTGRQFYMIAYMNLVIVLIILFIIALWKWG